MLQNFDIQGLSNKKSRTTLFVGLCKIAMAYKWLTAGGMQSEIMQIRFSSHSIFQL